MTDDPEPTRTGGWENYVYATETGAPGEIAGQGGVELNYGSAKALQLSASIPLDYETARKLRAGAGDSDLAAKHRFLHPPEGDCCRTRLFPRRSPCRPPHAPSTQVILPCSCRSDLRKTSTNGRPSAAGGYTLKRDPGGQALEDRSLTYSNEPLVDEDRHYPSIPPSYDARKDPPDPLMSRRVYKL